MGEWLLSRRDSTIVARHEVPGAFDGPSLAHAALETLGIPVGKVASDDVRPDFGCHERFLATARRSH